MQAPAFRHRPLVEQVAKRRSSTCFGGDRTKRVHDLVAD
jgi:hypothetical protein